MSSVIVTNQASPGFLTEHKMKSTGSGGGGELLPPRGVVQTPGFLHAGELSGQAAFFAFPLGTWSQALNGSRGPSFLGLGNRGSA